MRCFLLVLLIFSGCIIKEKNGYVFDDKETDFLPHIQNRNDILELMGDPTFEIENRLFYVSLERDRIAFFEPKVKKYKAIVFTFNDSGILEKYEKFNKTGAFQYKTPPKLVLDKIDF